MILFTVFGCSDLEVTQKKFVVEGSIFAGEIVDDIKIKEQVPITEPDTVELIIENAQVVMIKNDTRHLLTYQEGFYKDLESVLTVNSGDRFQIEVTVGDRIATAETVVPSATNGLALSNNTMVIPPIKFSLNLLNELNQLFFNVRITANWENSAEELYFVVAEYVDDAPDPLFPEGFPQEGIDFLSSFRFLPETTRADTFEIIGLAFENYGLHKATVYRVNQEYADLFDNQEQDSRDLTEPPSNVINGFGIFTSFAADSVFFNIVRQ